MSNTIGESISRLIEFSGADVKRANYQGDVGPHVAKALWGLRHMQLPQFDMAHMAEAYALGATAYEERPEVREEIDEINRLIYERSSEEINSLYDRGREASLAYFADIYKRLGTVFDFSFFESEVADESVQLVRANIGEVFEESDGAVVFRGEKYDPQLHTRVFLTQKGLPTYDAKELGLAQRKEQTWPADISITVTAAEQTEYFKVVRTALRHIFPKIAEKIEHIPHGHMRLPAGKMSSRTGDVVTAECVLNELAAVAHEKAVDARVSDAGVVAQQVAVGAMKYQILKQTAGKDIVFEFDRALSLEGDSGPYLQYAQTRAHSVLEKARAQGIAPETTALPDEVTALERLLYQFPEVVERAAREREPHYIATYLTSVAGEFNSWYAREKIVDERPEAPYRVALTRATQIVLLNGLWLLGISAPERM
jgi:arginyl-tRNA synthetase